MRRDSSLFNGVGGLAQLTSSALRLLVKAMAALPFLRLSEIHRFLTGESHRCLGKQGDDKRKRLKGSQGSRGHIPFSTPAGRGQTVLAKDRRSTAVPARPICRARLLGVGGIVAVGAFPGCLWIQRSCSSWSVSSTFFLLLEVGTREKNT